MPRDTKKLIRREKLKARLASVRGCSNCGKKECDCLVISDDEKIHILNDYAKKYGHLVDIDYDMTKQEYMTYLKTGFIRE
jgi:3-dehydroquinate dehydratase